MNPSFERVTNDDGLGDYPWRREIEMYRRTAARAVRHLRFWGVGVGLGLGLTHGGMLMGAADWVIGIGAVLLAGSILGWVGAYGTFEMEHGAQRRVLESVEYELGRRENECP